VPCERYAPIVSRSWTQFLCATFPDGNDVLVPAPHLNCYDANWKESQIYAMLTLALWGCVVPILIALVMEVYKRRLRTHEFSQKFSLVAFGLKKEFVAWDCVGMIKKFAVCATIVIFRDYTSLQPMLVLVVLLLFTVLTSLLRPFYNNIITYLFVAGEVLPLRSNHCHHCNQRPRSCSSRTMDCRFSPISCWYPVLRRTSRRRNKRRSAWHTTS
jgi:hypothetical protein